MTVARDRVQFAGSGKVIENTTVILKTGKICGEPDLNRRTPARIDLESIAVDQAWLSPRL
jgi:hypothetical protein